MPREVWTGPLLSLCCGPRRHRCGAGLATQNADDTLISFDRYKNQLDPSIKKEPWTQEEDMRIIQAQVRVQQCTQKLPGFKPPHRRL